MGNAFYIYIIAVQHPHVKEKRGYDIALVQRLLQHSSAAVTQRYIGIEPQRIERAIEGHTELLLRQLNIPIP